MAVRTDRTVIVWECIVYICVTNYTLSLVYIDSKNDTSFKKWKELTDAQRTVIASVVYQ